MRKFILLLTVLTLGVSISSNAQVYEEVHISDAERERSRAISTGLMFSVGHALPTLGLTTGFSSGMGIKFKYAHEISKVWIRAGIDYKLFSGKNHVVKYGDIYDFNKLNSIGLTTGIYIPIEISESFLILPGVESGWGVAWHSRFYTDIDGVDSYIYKETIVTYTYPINISVNLQYVLNDRIGFFIEPEFSMLFTFGLYSGLSEDGYYDFSGKEEFIGFNYNTNVGIMIFFKRG